MRLYLVITIFGSLAMVGLLLPALSRCKAGAVFSSGSGAATSCFREVPCVSWIAGSPFPTATGTGVSATSLKARAARRSATDGLPSGSRAKSSSDRPATS
jgi:hypothetical protein